MNKNNRPKLIYVGEYNGKSAFYSHLRNSIMIGEIHKNSFTEKSFIPAPECNTISEHIKKFNELKEKHNL